MTHQTQRSAVPEQRAGTGPRTTYVGIPQRLTTHQPFRGNSLSAGLPVGVSGRLTGEDRAAYMAAYRAGAIVYEVRSFFTPIAWLYRAGYTADEPVLRVYAVTEWFSPTTSRHQRLVAAYLRP